MASYRLERVEGAVARDYSRFRDRNVDGTISLATEHLLSRLRDFVSNRNLCGRDDVRLPAFAGRGFTVRQHADLSFARCNQVTQGVDHLTRSLCSVKESANFVGVGVVGPYQVEVSSGIKYGFLERPTPGLITVTDRAKKVLRPQDPQGRLDGLRDVILTAPVISDVYAHYRGENLPDKQFFHNALTDTFGVPSDKVGEFEEIFLESLKSAELISEQDGKTRIIDVSRHSDAPNIHSSTLKKLEKSVKVDASDTCFVMMPFAPPLGDYYAKIYKPAIEKAGLRPVRADADIFGTGKIIDQIWSGINSAKALVAELTSRNPNVFYELGLAHALEKPVVFVSSNDSDIPFDLKHIRVIYYDMTDPFWGIKLMDKVSENILSTIEHPEKAILSRKE